MPVTQKFVKAALAAGMALALLPASAGAQTFPGSNGRIAFASDRDGDYEIYTMDPDGSDLTRLTDDPAFDFWPSWSANGSKIAFASDRDGDWDIYVMDADGTDVTQLTDTGSNYEPTWSSDGTQIAFTRDARVQVMDADGSDVTQVSSQVDGNISSDSSPAWSPDGSLIAFTRFEYNWVYVLTVEPDGSDQTYRFNHAHQPAWSPDGGRIVYATTFHATPWPYDDIHIRALDGSGYVAVTDESGPTSLRDAEPVFSPDGNSVAFIRRLDGDDWEIACANSDGTGLVTLTDNAANEWSPSWQPVAGSSQGDCPDPPSSGPGAGPPDDDDGGPGAAPVASPGATAASQLSIGDKVKLEASHLVLQLRCVGGEPCTGSLVVEAKLAGAGTIVAARGEFSLAGGETAEVVAKLTRRGRRGFRFDRVCRLVVTATANDGLPLLAEQIKPPAQN